MKKIAVLIATVLSISSQGYASTLEELKCNLNGKWGKIITNEISDEFTTLVEDETFSLNVIEGDLGYVLQLQHKGTPIEFYIELNTSQLSLQNKASMALVSQEKKIAAIECMVE